MKCKIVLSNVAETFEFEFDEIEEIGSLVGFKLDDENQFVCPASNIVYIISKSVSRGSLDLTELKEPTVGLMEDTPGLGIGEDRE